MHRTRSAFVALVTVLLGIGVLMVCSSSMTARPTDFDRVYLLRHLAFLGIAVGASFVATRIPAAKLFQFAPTVFGATVLLLVAVLIPGLGTRVKGSQRWLRLGAASFQPSELAKITLPLFLCWVRLRHRTGLRTSMRELGEVLIPIGVVSGLILLEPDLGTAVFIAGIGGLTLFLGGFPLRRFAVGLAALVPLAATMLWMKPYQMRRIEGFLQTWSNFQDAPYQVKQSLTTIGTGGLTGVGLGRGWQKLSFLPEANTDFVFSVVGEELGLIGTLTVMAAWVAILLTGMRLLRPFSMQNQRFVVGAVLLSQLVFQAAVNIAVVSAMLPPKGIAHPLLSAGGSSLVGSLLAVGVFLSMTTQKAACEPATSAPLAVPTA
jgi:cell division protein FtsW